jgi:hypothetical protein
VTVEGLYESKAGGPIQWLAFQPSNHYVLAYVDALKSPLPTVEEGAYAFNDARTTVTFTTSAGRSKTMNFAVLERGGQQTATLASRPLSLIDSGGGLISYLITLLVGDEPMARTNRQPQGTEDDPICFKSACGKAGGTVDLINYGVWAGSDDCVCQEESFNPFFWDCTGKGAVPNDQEYESHSRVCS